MKQIAALALVLFAAYGCSVIPQVEKDSADGQASLSFEPDPNRGVMYLYRDRDSDFGVVMLNIYIAEHTVNTSPGCFVRVELDPGTYFVEANHTDVFGFEDEMTFEARAGEVSFFEYKPISRLVVPGETKIIERSRENAIETITKQDLCISPVVQIGT